MQTVFIGTNKHKNVLGCKINRYLTVQIDIKQNIFFHKSIYTLPVMIKKVDERDAFFLFIDVLLSHTTFHYHRT